MATKEDTTSKVYYVAFRLEYTTTYDDRDNCIYETIGNLSNFTFWYDPMTFIVFRSSSDIDEIANDIKKCLITDEDVAVVGEIGSNPLRTIGNANANDESICSIVSQARHV